MSNSSANPPLPEPSFPSKVLIGPGAGVSSSPLPAVSVAPMDAAEDGTRRPGLQAIVHAFRRSWLIALPLAAVVAVSAGSLGAFLWRPSYRAAAYLQIASRQPVLLNTRDTTVQPAYEIYKRTQREVIRNRFVLNAALRDAEVARLPLIQEQLDPVSWLQKNLQVEYPGDAEVLEISMRGESPLEIATIVNAVCTAYMQDVVDRERESRYDRLHNLEKALNDLDEKLRQKRTERNSLGESLGISDANGPTPQQAVIIQSHGAVVEGHLAAKADLVRLQSRRSAIQARLKGLPQLVVPAEWIEEMLEGTNEYLQAKQEIDQLLETQRSFAEVTANPKVLAELKSALSKGEQDLAAIRQRLWPIAEKTVRRQMQKKLEKELTSLEADLHSLVEQEKHLRAEVEQHNQQVQRINRSSVDLQMLIADIEQFETIRKQLATELDSLNVELSSAPRVVQLSRATPPQTSEGSSRIRQAAIFGGTAFGLPLVGIIYWDLRRRRVNSTQDVALLPGLPLVGTLPLLPPRIHRKLAVTETSTYWDRIFIDAVDAVREIVHRDSKPGTATIVMVTSAIGGEGKTTLASQLAMSFGRMGKSTAIVDFDLRRPATHHVFQEDPGAGITELLREEVEFDDIVRPTSHRNLYRISAGRVDRESTQALCQRRRFLEEVFKKLRVHFEIVVVDCCPVLPAVDAMIVGQFTDGALLSVMRDVSQTNLVEECRSRLQRMGVPVLGAVVISKERQGYHNQYRYVASEDC